MPVTFYGEWSLTVVAKNASFDERVRIAGSVGSDGPVDGVAGQSVASIDGASWQAFMEWSADGGASWFPSRIRRLLGVTADAGLIITLYADDNTPSQGDGDYNDLLVQFTYLNRKINPLGPATPPYSYTLPQGSFWPPRPGGDDRGNCCCRYVCTCKAAQQSRRGCRC